MLIIDTATVSASLNLYLPARKYINTTLNIHNLVMPKPEEIYEMATAFGKQQGMETDTLSIDMYKSERELVVLIPVK